MDELGSHEGFTAVVEPHRRELLAHCYRMLGSVQDAEDMVQETLLRAWRAQGSFEGRASVRTWLYRIATNVCLTMLAGRPRRPLPTGLGQPPSDPTGALEARPEVPWLEPLPDDLVWGRHEPEPDEAVVSRESVRLAFVAALQHLTAQQRAVLILRDVLAWSAAEVAAALDVSVAAVNSSLQRARAHLAATHGAPDGAGRTAGPGAATGAGLLVDEFADAFERYDVGRIAELLTADAVWEMPPFTGWYSGPAQIARLIATQCPASGPGDMRMVRTSANGQPVLALYMRGDDGVHRAFQLQHLTLRDGRVAHVACFFDTQLFGAFGLPEVLARPDFSAHLLLGDEPGEQRGVLAQPG